MLLFNYRFNFYEIIITVFQFTQHAIENRSTYHTWHACRRLPTPVLGYFNNLVFQMNIRLQVYMWFSQNQYCR